MNQAAVILIDFDNLFKKNIQSYTIDNFKSIFQSIVDDILQMNDKVEEIMIRLYGGWYTKNKLTPKAQEIEKRIGDFDISRYPFKNKKVKVSVNLVFSLNALPNDIWTNTRQEKEGLPNLKVNSEFIDEMCENNKDRCPVKIINKFTKKKGKVCSIDSCLKTNNRIFTTIQQKMVDTLIACDLITFSEKNEYIEIILISDDIDFFPALALVSTKIEQDSQKVTLFIANKYNYENYKAILGKFKINLRLLNKWRN